MKQHSSARTVSIDPLLLALAIMGMLIALVTLGLSSPFNGPSVQDLNLSR